MGKESRKQAIESLKTVINGFVALENDIVESGTVEKDMEVFYKLQELHHIYRDAYAFLTRDLTLKFDEQFEDKAIAPKGDAVIKLNDKRSAKNVPKDDADRKLDTMGAAWFVSYAYYNLCDKNHKNWEKAGTIQPRLSSYKNGQKSYLKLWLNKVLEKNDKKLKNNQIDLDPTEVKRMALEILSKLKF